MSLAPVAALHRSLLLLLLTLLTGSCGFQLRGQVEVADTLQPLAIAAPGGSLVAPLLDHQLKLAGVGLVEAGQGEQALLRVVNEQFDRRDLALGRGGRQREVELTLLLEFELVGRDATPLLDRQRILLQRDYLFDEQALLGKQQEAERLQQELAQDAVRQLIHRIRRVE